MPLLDALVAPEGNRQLHIILWHLPWFFLIFAAWQSLRLSCKIAKRNQFICWAFIQESHTVLACNLNQDSEAGRKRMDGYLLVWWHCCLQKKFKVNFPCKKWEGVSNWNEFTSANFRQGNRNPGTSCIKEWLPAAKACQAGLPRRRPLPGKKPFKTICIILITKH